MPYDSDELEPSAMFQHCARVYGTMFKQATRTQADGTTTMVVYEGFLTKLVREELGLPTPYYTKIRQLLMTMGCIRQLRRGGSTSPSQWELLHEPTADLWSDMPEPETPAAGIDVQFLQMLSDLGRRMNRIEEAVGLAGVPLPKE